MRGLSVLGIALMASVILSGCSSSKNVVVNFKAYGALTEKEQSTASCVFDWAKHQAATPEQALVQDLGIPKSLPVGFIDLNQDTQLDVLAVPGKTWCKGGECSLYAFLTPNCSPVSIGKVLLIFPLKVKKHATGGLQDLILNTNTECAFSKEKNTYVCH